MKITNPKTFDIAVKERANERVQAKIKNLKATIQQAIKDFGYDLGGFSHPKMETVLSVLAEKPDSKSAYQEKQFKCAARGYAQCALIAVASDGKLPQSIWKTEEAQVEAELLATLDEISKALLSSQKQRPEGEIEPD